MQLLGVFQAAVSFNFHCMQRESSQLFDNFMLIRKVEQLSLGGGLKLMSFTVHEA